MALEKLGYVRCPNCAKMATVGITKDGEGDAVHVYCRRCLLTIQVSRWQDLGPRILNSISRSVNEGSRENAVFASWL